MKLKEHKRLLEEAVAAEREACAEICESYDIGHTFSQLRNDLAAEIRARGPAFKGYIRPETAEKHPELLQQGYRIAGVGLSADGQRIIGNWKGHAEHPVVGGTLTEPQAKALAAIGLDHAPATATGLVGRDFLVKRGLTDREISDLPQCNGLYVIGGG